jgi:Domain of unknown function (DUF1876)
MTLTPDDRSKKVWHLDATVDEHERRTRAKVRLSWRGNKLVGVGQARLDPADEPVAAAGDELALAYGRPMAWCHRSSADPQMPPARDELQRQQNYQCDRDVP